MKLSSALLPESAQFSLNRQGVINGAGVQGAEILGLKQSDLIGSSFFLYLSEESIPLFQRFLKNIFLASLHQNCEIMLSAEGKHLVLAQLEGWMSDIPELCYIAATILGQDAKLEGVLRHSEDKFRKVFNLHPGIVGISTFSEGKYLDINRHFLDVLGWKREEVIGHTAKELNIFTDYSQRQEIISVMNLQGYIRDYEVEIKTKKGEIRLGLFSAEFIEMEGQKCLLAQLYDYTDRKKSAEKLRESEEKYRTLLEFAPDAFFHGNSKGNFITVNTKASDLTGFSKEELLAMNMSDLFPGSEIAEKPLRYDLLKVGEIIITERRLLKKSGDILFVEMNSRAMPDGTFQSFIRDITERKLLEEALKTRSEFLKRTGKLARVGGWEIYIPTKKVIWSDEVYALHELPVGETPGLEDVINYYHPDDRYMLLDAIDKATRLGEAFNLELRLITAKKNSLWVRIFCKPILHNGKTQRLTGAVQDITDRKMTEDALQESEEKHRLLLDESSDPIFTFYPDGVYRYVNQAFAKGVGKPVEEITGKKIWDVFSKEEADKRYAAVKWVFENHEEKVIEVRVPRPDGDHYYITTVKPIISEQGIVITVICISKEITKRKKDEERLAVLNHQLEELNTTKDKLFSIIAHDLRGPFNSILGFSELLGEHLQNHDFTQSEDSLQRIHTTAKHTLDLLDNLLAWAGSQTGQINFNPQAFPLHQVFRMMESLINPAAVLKNITLDFPSDRQIEVYSDKQMLRLILRNLISNAVKFTHPGGTIRITVKAETENVVITIADNGVGMNEERRSMLFNTASHFTTYGTANEKGSGLGLLLCREFTSIQGGTIWVDSEEGKGSRFNFTVPVP